MTTIFIHWLFLSSIIADPPRIADPAQGAQNLLPKTALVARSLPSEKRKDGHPGWHLNTQWYLNVHDKGDGEEEGDDHDDEDMDG